MDLDKWQQREAQDYARDNDVSYEAAVKVLFPPAELVAEVAEVPASGKSAAKASAAK